MREHLTTKPDGKFEVVLILTQLWNKTKHTCIDASDPHYDNNSIPTIEQYITYLLCDELNSKDIRIKLV